MMSRPQEVSTDAEEILHDTVNRREPLKLSGRPKTPHLALTLARRLMGDLRAVVRVLIGAVEHRWHHRATGGRVAGQLVGDQASRHLPLVTFGWNRSLSYRIPAREPIAPYGADPPFALEWLRTDRHSRNTQRGPK